MFIVTLQQIKKTYTIMLHSTLTLTDADDMQISPYLVPDNLPKLLKDCLNLAKTTEEKDILLLSILTAVSSTLSKVSFAYGHMGKHYYPNLQTFIMAGAASGKGVSGLAQELLRPIHDSSPLFLAGDSSYPAFFKALYDQQGVGYLYESEGSVITDIWKSGAMSYNTALRKAAEHEALSRNRCNKGTKVIALPKLSMLLTGTFDQFQTLVPSVQNGFFSRLTMLVIRGRQEFDQSIFMANTDESSRVISACGHRLLRLYEQLVMLDDVVTFSLTHEQALRLGRHFHREYGALIQSLGDNFHPSVVRSGITTMRIAAVLTAMRHADAGGPLSNDWECDPDDYDTAVLISSKLLLHAADAYCQINGSDTMAVPSSTKSVQRETLFALLPNDFGTAECLKHAECIGVSVRSAKRWLEHWEKSGVLKRLHHGQYTKVA